MGEYLLRLSWPSQPLWQNRPCHWAKRARAVKAYRQEAWAIAKHHGVQRHPEAEVLFKWYPPDRRRRDVQNMPATMKAAIDGIADAMGCDDENFRPHFPGWFEETTKGGCVLVHIRA